MSADSDHDWEQSVKVKGIVKVSIGPYSEIIKEIKRKSQQLAVNACLQRPYSGAYKNFRSGF
jgi:hypothetical protein